MRVKLSARHSRRLINSLVFLDTSKLLLLQVLFFWRWTICVVTFSRYRMLSATGFKGQLTMSNHLIAQNYLVCTFELYRGPSDTVSLTSIYRFDRLSKEFC